MPYKEGEKCRTRSVVVGSPSSPGLLSVAESSQLSQSAPSIMEPLLCSNTMIQARAHIQTRLGSQDTGNEQKLSQGLLHPRTPKLLAPLDTRPRDIGALPVLKPHVPLKPISGSPLCSRTRLRRERLSRGSPRTGTLTTKGGSEESGSSSSQSSIDLEDEEEEDKRDMHERASGENHLKFVGDGLLQHSNDVSSAEADLVGETMWHFNVQSRISHIPAIHKSAHNLDGEPINHTSDLLITEKAINSHCEVKGTTKEPVDSQSFMKFNDAQRGDSMNPTKDKVDDEIPITSKSKEEKNNVGESTEPENGVSQGTTFNMNDDLCDAIKSSEGNYRHYLQHIKQTERTMKDSWYEEARVDNPVPHRKDIKLNTSTAEKRTELFTSAVTHPQSDMKERDEKVLKVLKPIRSKERRTSICMTIQTNQQSLLAHKDRSILNKLSKSNLKYSSLSTQVKDKTRKTPDLVINGETVTKVKPKLKSVKSAHCNTGTPSPRKKVSDHAQSKRANPDKLSSNSVQQHSPARELKSIRQLKRPGLAGTPRSKSAVDFITYKDMFQQIQSGEEGPAIYEMFAGPIFDNLRVSSSCEKVKDRQVQSAKVKHRPLKQAQSKLKRSPGERMVVSAKSKPRLASSRVKHNLTPVSKKGPHKIKDVGEHKETELVLSNDVDTNRTSAHEKIRV
ncbi:uncharacterized protein LOC118339256 [Morone saxatilis]|uniref:uncharacterized protein LOC118339256 n=1 Tax=Morone saxatilis TaxID=34816 RepID=UPI0015E1DD16|nr:uncharacterized protein LOC118339256 [Morone saxatilis]